MSQDNKKDIDRPKRVQKLAEDLAELCDDEQKFHTSKAQEFGYARNVLTDIKDVFVRIPYDEPLLDAVEYSLTKFKQFIEMKRGSQQYKTDISSMAYFFGTSIIVTGSVIDPNKKIYEIYNIPKPPSFWPRDRIKIYALRLDELDEELGKVYRSIWSSLLGNQENPERVAMYQMRQAYDHFFDIIAPDEEVRQSTYFTRKTGNTFNTVTRREKIHYAANEKVQEKELRELLLAQDEYIVKLYNRLNKAHKRETIDRTEAMEILNSMQMVLEQWIDAVGL